MLEVKWREENKIQKTKIDWADYTINPVKGLCPMACSYCYARRMYKRFHWNPEIRLQPYWWNDLAELKPSRIFVGSTIELFGNWVKPEWLTQILRMCKAHKKHTFIFLTKQPWELIKSSPFSDNCWVGVSADTMVAYQAARNILPDIQARVRFISFEPLLERVIMTDTAYVTPLSKHFCDWVIIGAQTPYSPKTAPQKEWVDEIIDTCDEMGIPVFLKNNLRPVLKSVYGDNPPMRQEYPVVKL